MSLRSRAAAAFLYLALIGCTNQPALAPVPRTGAWRMILDLGENKLPFHFDLQRKDSLSWVATIRNASETIGVHDIEMRGDSFLMRMPLFDSEFKGVVENDSTISGLWHNYLKGPEYRIPFLAHAGRGQRFTGSSNPQGTFGGTWEVHFSKGTTDAYDAIGIFNQDEDGLLTGTFLTETGDYRFLEGTADEDSLHLSCFDGSHAFLFNGALQGDSIVGGFWSGIHWNEPWVAYRNPDFHLRDPDSLTFLKEGHDMAEVAFPDLEGRIISTHDDRFKGKVLMLQVMGSWCPNCVDETILLKQLHADYGDQGLEVMALAFEKYDEEDRAIAGLKRFKHTMGVEYPIVYGGSAAKENASAKLPFLDHIMSYPTCIFVDRTGKVRRIRTGFYGPSTGEHYTNYTRGLRVFIEQLLQEGAEPMPLATKG
jgi:thiol-disulfide isomerase/thioredoxin